MVDNERLTELVTDRLALYGVTEPKTELVTYAIGKATEYVLNFCNIDEIPDRLAFATAGVACAGYIDTARITGLIEDSAVSSVRVGDTQVTMGSETPSWSGIVDAINAGARAELVRYRRMSF